MCLVRICTSIEDAVAEIDHFFSNYVSFDVRGDRGYVTGPTTRRRDAQLAELADVVPRFAQGAGYVLEDDATISFAFDGRNYVNLRLLINRDQRVGLVVTRSAQEHLGLLEAPAHLGESAFELLRFVTALVGAARAAASKMASATRLSRAPTSSARVVEGLH